MAVPPKVFFVGSYQLEVVHYDHPHAFLFDQPASATAYLSDVVVGLNDDVQRVLL